MPFKPRPAPSGWLEERRLLSEARAGKEHAVARLAAEHGPALHGLAAELAGPGEAADSLLEATLLRAATWSALRREDQSLGPWMWGLMLSLARERQAGPPAPEPAGELPRRPVAPWREPAVDDGTRAALQQALGDAGRRLPRRLQAAWLLCDVLGHAPAGAAAALELSPGMVKARLHRARLILREELARRAATLPVAALPALPGGMECADFTVRLRAGLAGELSESRQETWNLHRAGCADCGALVHTYGLTVELARRDTRAVPAAVELAAAFGAVFHRARAAAAAADAGTGEAPAADMPPEKAPPAGS